MDRRLFLGEAVIGLRLLKPSPLSGEMPNRNKNSVHTFPLMEPIHAFESRNFPQWTRLANPKCTFPRRPEGQPVQMLRRSKRRSGRPDVGQQDLDKTFYELHCLRKCLLSL